MGHFRLYVEALLLLGFVHAVGGGLHGLGLKAPALPVVLPPSSAELAMRIKGWSELARMGKELRAERRAHAHGGTCQFQRPGRPEIEPELSESSEEEMDTMDDDEWQLQSSLWAAARRGDSAGVAFAVEAGADVNAPDRESVCETALHLAAASGCVEAVGLLLGFGADVQGCDRQGRTPLHWALREDSGTVGRDPRAHQYEAPLRVVQALLRSDADPCARDHDGRTPLMYAALKGWKLVCEELLGAGAMVDGADVDGYTAMHLAAHQGRPGTVSWLLHKDADAAFLNVYGQTPAGCALMWWHSNVIEALRVFRDALEGKAEPETGSVLGRGGVAKPARRGLKPRGKGRVRPRVIRL